MVVRCIGGFHAAAAVDTLLSLERPGFRVGSFKWMPRPAWRLPDCSARGLRAVIDAGESATLELKATLRKNLHTGQHDWRIEQGTLKTIAAFLNTKGGTLVVGVADDGTTLGVQEEDFPNEDKMGLHLVTLVKARMGALHMSHVGIRFEEYNGQRVMVVECEPSPSPVYLNDKEGNVERFYIRTGASTTELKLSETQAYIRKRFGRA